MSRRRALVGTAAAVTGGGRGIGRSTAAALARAGARVALGDVDVEAAEAAAAQIGPDAVGLGLDVTDRASFAGFLDAAEERLGPLGALVNNAGIMPVGRLAEEPDAVTRRMVDVNLHGVLLGSKLALERMLPRRSGHLVNIASQAGRAGFAGGVTYCATKHAVVGLSEALADELHGTGIEVSCVMPGVVNTELTSGFPTVRLMTAIEPEDVAAAIVAVLERPRPRVHVPRTIGPTLTLMGLLPRRVRETAARAMGAERPLLRVDEAARVGYETRARGSGEQRS